MNNIRMLTGGLVIIVLGLAGGTGYLIYDRIQSEVTGDKRVTMEEFSQTRQDVGQLKESDKMQSARITVLEDEVVDAKGRLTNAEGKLEMQDKLIKELEKDTSANRDDIEIAKKQRDELATQLEDQRTQLEEVQSSLDAAKQERQQIREQLAAQASRIDQQEQRLNDMDKKGEARDKEMAEMRQELADIKRLLRELGIEDESPSS